MKIRIMEGLEIKVTKKGTWKMKVKESVSKNELEQFLEFAQAWDEQKSVVGELSLTNIELVKSLKEKQIEIDNLRIALQAINNITTENL